MNIVSSWKILKVPQTKTLNREESAHKNASLKHNGFSRNYFINLLKRI